MVRRPRLPAPTCSASPFWLRRAAVGPFGALAAACFAGPAAAQPGAPLTGTDVEAFADSAFARYVREYPAPSLAMVVVRGDSILLMKGYGTEDPEGRRRVDVEATLFHIASVSKLVVATAAMQLVERGEATLDGDIEPLLGGVRIAGSGPPVTLRALLTHTSGLEGPFLHEVVADARDLVPLREYFARYPPRRGRPPGYEVRYSNYGAALVGYLVERLSGEAFHDYAERHVFAPLGMTRSSFRQPPPAGLAERRATAGAGHVRNALLAYPAGSMVSSAADMARFMLAHLNGGRAGPARILADSSVRLMHAPQWRADPRMPGVGLGLFESTIGGEPGLFHTGARIHFSLLYLFPDRRTGVFLVHAMQQGGAFQTLRTDFVRGFASRYFPHPSPPRRLDTGPSGRAAEFAGVYRPRLLPTTTIERAAELFADTRVRVGSQQALEVRIPGGRTLSLEEIDDGLYRVPRGPDEGLTIAFPRAAGGVVRGMAMAGSTQDPVSFERLAWYWRGTLHAALLPFVLCALGELASASSRVLRRRPRTLGPPVARRAWGVAIAASALVAAAPLPLAALVLTRWGDDAAAGGLRFALAAGCTLLLAGTVAGVALVPLSVRAWRAGYWSLRRRLFFSGLAAGAVVAAPLLYHYHLLGYWF